MILKFGAYLAIAFFFITCSQVKKEELNTALKNEYAKGFSVLPLENNKVKVIVYHPQTGQQLDELIIDQKAPKKVIPLSATHISFIDVLDELQTVKAVTFGESIFNFEIKEKMKHGDILNLGQDAAPNKELILSINPDLIFSFPGSQSFEDQLNIPELTVTEFLETHPLAQLEWIKVFGLIYGKYDQATSYFDSIKLEYNNLIVQDPETPLKKIMCGELWDQNWALPGGKSLINQYIKDAGASYHSFGDSGTGSTKIDFEVVLNNQKEIDKWLLTTYSLDTITRSKLLEKNQKYQLLTILNQDNEKAIAICNTAEKPYFERSIVEPHLVLKDIIVVVTENNDSTTYFSYLQIKF